MLLLKHIAKRAILSGSVLLSCTPVFANSDRVGLASWYGPHEAGRRTASGKLFDPAKLSAAHRTLPLGSCVRVTRLSNHRSLVVPITDRGPFIGGRLIDLSMAAAARLGMIRRGLAYVTVTPETCNTLNNNLVHHKGPSL